MKMLHLYPNLMNLYGDYGNIVVLAKHLNDQGISVQIDKKEVQDNVDFSKYDFIYMGSGTEKNQLVALNDLMNYKTYLIDYIENNKTILFTGNAMELLGRSINDLEALNIIDFDTDVTDKRYTGDVLVKNELIGEVLGFINKSSIIHGGEEYKLFDYQFKGSDLIDNEFEGYYYHNLFGTHIIGPVLVKNPNFMTTIVKCLIGERYKALKYRYEDDAYDYNLQQLKLR